MRFSRFGIVILVAVVPAMPALAGPYHTSPAAKGAFQQWHQQQNGELDMIQLQNVGSQRQTSLQMTTNLMNSMNEAARTVVGNMGDSGSSDDD